MTPAPFARFADFLLKGVKQIGLSLTYQMKWTGDQETGKVKWEPIMAIKSVQLLNEAQDAVYENPQYQPHGDDTFCNYATQAVLSKLGYAKMNGLTADAMHLFVSNSKDWLIKPISDAQSLANEGAILLAILPAVKLGQSHGHVCSCTTGSGDFSGHWNIKTPMVMNLGRKGTCFRQRGVNYAFQVIPEIYALRETL